MAFLARLTLLAVGAWILGLAAVVVLQIVTGRIIIAGLLASKDADGRASFSPARLQLLIFTVVVAAQYLFKVIANPRQDALPSLPPGVVAAVGGSQAMYLAGKIFTTYIRPLLKDSEGGG
jgi:uncharacterized BrkB/YihY/UPF0761 family membrane protein